MKRALILLAGVCSGTAFAQDSGVPGRSAPEFRIEGNINKPTQLPADPARLKLPDGYRVDIVARDLGNARMLAVGADGAVYVTRRSEADVLLLKDTDGDGRYEVRRVVASRPDMHGIAIDGSTAYLMTAHEIFTAPVLAGGDLGPLTQIVGGLPAAGQHPNRTLGIGPDGMIYASVGSTCNACVETSPFNATMMQISKDGKQRKIHASGLRNTIGFDWNPRNGQLWGMDHGIDWLGDEAQPEELNSIEQGKRYGWPYIYADGRRNPQDVPPNGLTMEDWDRMSERMVAGYTAHAAPMQMAFNRGTGFARDTQGDAFVAMRGSWNRTDPKGYEVVRIRFDANGKPGQIEPFMTGFLTRAPGGEAGWTGRPTGLAFAPDGSMLVTDSENGVLYRVRYEGTDRPAAELAKPVMPAARPPAGPIAMARPETQASGKLKVSSAAFNANGMLAERFSDYHQKVSPPIAWTGAPEGTRSFAILVDDPDAASVKPVAHWVAWNIPATTTNLPEGLPGTPQLASPKTMRQGANQAGSTGWYGPRPPIGDRPHRYHVQVFALDSQLTTLPGATREQLLQDMRGHVLAKGEIIGRYAQPRPPAKP